jgi:hypothetical protein
LFSSHPPPLFLFVTNQVLGGGELAESELDYKAYQHQRREEHHRMMMKKKKVLNPEGVPASTAKASGGGGRLAEIVLDYDAPGLLNHRQRPHNRFFNPYVSDDGEMDSAERLSEEEVWQGEVETFAKASLLEIPGVPAMNSIGVEIAAGRRIITKVVKESDGGGFNMDKGHQPENFKSSVMRKEAAIVAGQKKQDKKKNKQRADELDARQKMMEAQQKAVDRKAKKVEEWMEAKRQFDSGLTVGTTELNNNLNVTQVVGSQLQAAAGDWSSINDTPPGVTVDSFDYGPFSDPKQQLDGMTNLQIVELIRKAGIPG